MCVVGEGSKDDNCKKTHPTLFVLEKKNMTTHVATLAIATVLAPALLERFLMMLSNHAVLGVGNGNGRSPARDAQMHN